MTNKTKPIQSKKHTAGKFEALLEAWRDGQNVAWAELMAAWVEAPTAPRTHEIITRLIKRLDAE